MFNALQLAEKIREGSDGDDHIVNAATLLESQHGQIERLKGQLETLNRQLTHAGNMHKQRMEKLHQQLDEEKSDRTQLDELIEVASVVLKDYQSGIKSMDMDHVDEAAESQELADALAEVLKKCGG